MKKISMEKIIVLYCLLFGLFLLAGCASEKPTESADAADTSGGDSTEGASGEEVAEQPQPVSTEETVTETKVTTTEGAQATIVDVTTSGLTFTPNEVTINVGDSVRFSVPSSHNVVQVSPALWDANKNEPETNGFSVDFGETKEVLFSTAGTYYYVCQPHAAVGMKGKIVVK